MAELISKQLKRGITINPIEGTEGMPLSLTRPSRGARNSSFEIRPSLKGQSDMRRSIDGLSFISSVGREPCGTRAVTSGLSWDCLLVTSGTFPPPPGLDGYCVSVIAAPTGHTKHFIQVPGSRLERPFGTHPAGSRSSFLINMDQTFPWVVRCHQAPGPKFHP